MVITRISLLALLLLGASAYGAPSRLVAYEVELSQSSVSGVSAGAFMAVQFHVAFSSAVTGAGVVAGGPYYCTRGRRWGLWLHLSRCTQPFFWQRGPDARRLLADAQAFARAGEIDDLANLRADRIYIFSGRRDYVVDPSVVRQAAAFYRAAGVPAQNIRFVDDLDAGHAWVTLHHGNPCPVTAPPFINDCNYDQAGAILTHIYGPLNPPAAAAAGGRIIEVSQTEFVADARAHGMSESAYVYVPNACTDGTRCRVHVAFHGCGQTTEAIGDLFYTRAGYNEWASTNRIIVLYPQLVRLAWKNPEGCWDWWGYDSTKYYAKEAPQMAAVMRMIRRLAGEP